MAMKVPSLLLLSLVSQKGLVRQRGLVSQRGGWRGRYPVYYCSVYLLSVLSLLALLVQNFEYWRLKKAAGDAVSDVMQGE